MGILLQAAVKSPASVLFVIGLPTAVTHYFPYADILEIPLSRRGLEELVRFIHATYKRDASGQTIPLGSGHNHRHSMFYLAEGDYSLFNTCNTWITKALQAAGLPIRDSAAGGRSDEPGEALWPDDPGAGRGRRATSPPEGPRDP